VPRGPAGHRGRRAAGSASTTICASCSTRRDLGTTAPAVRSLVSPEISSRRRNFRPVRTLRGATVCAGAAADRWRCAGAGSWQRRAGGQRAGHPARIAAVCRSTIDILEVSADLRARQQQRLDGSASAAAWHACNGSTRCPATNPTGVLLTNEVADALPFKRFVIRSGEPCSNAAWRYRGERRQLMESDRAGQMRAARGSRARRRALRKAPGPVARRIRLGTVSDDAAVDRRSGGVHSRAHAILLIDYGCSRREYYHPQRAGGHVAVSLPPSRT
jgi:hypothetical protein